MLPLTKTIRTVGLVEYDQRRLNTINTKVEGWVEKLYVNFTGTYVKKGEPVADIYSPELWATQQEFINVVRWAKGAGAKDGTGAVQTADAQGSGNIGTMIESDAQSLVEAARQRLKLFDISDAQIKRIEESEKPIRDLTVYSPYSGYVLQKNVNQGTRVMPGTDLLDVADLSTVWITADIYEFEMPLIKVGDAASVQLSYFPGRAVLHKDRLYLSHPPGGDEDAEGAVHPPQRGRPAQAADVHQRGAEDQPRAGGSRSRPMRSSTRGCGRSLTWTRGTATSSRGRS